MVDKILSSSKAKNVDVLKKQIDFEKVTLDGEEIKGLNEQIEALQKSDSYLFNVEEPTKTVDLGGEHNQTKADDNAEARRIMGLS